MKPRVLLLLSLAACGGNAASAPCPAPVDAGASIVDAGPPLGPDVYEVNYRVARAECVRIDQCYPESLPDGGEAECLREFMNAVNPKFFDDASRCTEAQMLTCIQDVNVQACTMLAHGLPTSCQCGG